jgi:NAD+ synthase (glutamine-hydrolysing)
MRLALAQINPIVGDLDGNRALIVERIEEAKRANADLVFPELAVTGYPPGSAPASGLSPRGRGSLDRSRSPRAGSSCSWARRTTTATSQRLRRLRGRRVKAMVKKRFLPNYGVFDEMRYSRRDELVLFEHGESLIGVTVCEDMWQPGPPRPISPSRARADRERVGLAVPPDADREREECSRRARDNSAYVAFCNTSADRTS